MKTAMAGNLDEVLRWSLVKLARAIRDKHVSPVEVTRRLLERIESVDRKLNAYITVLPEKALLAASQAETEILASTPKGQLHGVPVGLKDIIYTEGIRTTMGSEHFADFIPDHDAAVVERLKKAGAVIVGKLNTHQFAYGPTGDRSYYGPIRNPYNPAKVSGGSSGGSGAAVAAFLCYAALGTDTAGSVRIPASCCGIVGMKPTFGRVSKYGVFPLGWTLDHVGPMTRTVEDNAVLLSVLSGYDARDAYSAPREREDFARDLRRGVAGLTLGIPTSFYFERVHEDVAEKVWQAVDVLRDLGAKVREVDIPGMEETLAAVRLTLATEAYAVHRERLLTEPEKFEEEVRERLLTGEELRAYAYAEAQQTKLAATEAYLEALEEADIIVSPTIPLLPPDIDQRQTYLGGQDEQVRSAITRLTGPTNLNGLPSLSVPCGSSVSGLPIGLQFVGKPFDEATLYRFGHALESKGPVSPLEYDALQDLDLG